MRSNIDTDRTDALKNDAPAWLADRLRGGLRIAPKDKDAPVHSLATGNHLQQTSRSPPPPRPLTAHAASARWTFGKANP